MNQTAPTHDPRRRTHEWAPPWLPAESGKDYTGLEFVEALVRGDIPAPPIASTIGYRLTEATDGRVVCAAKPHEFHYNPFGSVHGGFAATVLDSALGLAVLSTLGRGVGFTTLEFKINLVRALYADSPEVLGEGWIVHRGKRIATSEARLVDSDGVLYAHASSTCMVFDVWHGNGGDKKT